MQKKLFQTLLIVAIIGASIGQAYAQGSCTVSAPTPTPPKPPKDIPKSEREAWTANWIANWNANYYKQQCDQWATAQCQSTFTGVCLTDYKSECPWCFCECSSTSPNKENAKDKRVERHKEVINENSATNGNASE
jgi:hypothetical protein